jgi:hypothetical protein
MARFVCSVCAPLRAWTEHRVEKLGILYRQNEMPGNAMFFVSNLQSSSQAGRRGFESRLPLHVFNNFRGSSRRVLRLCSVNFARGSKISGTNHLRVADVLRLALVTSWRRVGLGRQALEHVSRSDDCQLGPGRIPRRQLLIQTSILPQGLRQARRLRRLRGQSILARLWRIDGAGT